MPIQPQGGDLYVSQPLTNVSVAYQQDAAQFIAGTIFPAAPVDLQGGLYWEYLMDDWTRSIAEERAPATESAGGGWDVTTHPYFARVYAVHKDIDNQTRQNASGGPFNLDADATRWCTQQLLIKRDQLFVSSFLTTGVWANDAVLTNPWDAANSTPIEDITNTAVDMGELTGRRPNILLLGARVLPALLNNAQIVERVKYSGSGFPTEQVLSQAFNVDRIVTAEAIQNIAPKGAPKATKYMFDKQALLVYAAPNPGLLTPSGGYTFTWTGLLGAGATGGRIRNYRMEELDSDRIEGEMGFDMRVVGRDLGTFFTNAIT